MLVQAVALGIVASAHSFGPWLAAAVVLGLGTALVYQRHEQAVQPGATNLRISSAIRLDCVQCR